MTEPSHITHNVMSGSAHTVVQAGTVVFGATGDMPVDEAVRDLTPLFADVLSDGFTGRQWLIDQIDAFLAERRCGYLWVEGDAGVGKTALAAHLVRERGWPGHFSRLTRGGSARGALRNLAGQLAREHGLVPDGLLPERWCTPEGFESLLARIPAQVVLVVDGADEAEQVAGAQPWGLPLELPPGVFVVGTYRTGSPPPKTGSVLRLTAADPRNIADVASHVARVQPDGDLVTRCGGVWVYLRYVLNEIRQGVRSATDPLPPDLTAYYVENLERWSRSDWQNILPIISTLTAAGEPLGAQQLAQLSQVDEQVVREHCHRTLRPFLGAVDGQAGRGFAWYHASLREFLTGIYPGCDASDQAWRWWETLSSATVAAHNRI
ncbi:MAG TPA: NACHT domain-containing protein, partial [Lentzea sp.]